MTNWINDDVYESLIITPETQMTLSHFLKFYKRYPVIAITWPAWVGKSTITNLVASYIWAEIYTEVPDNNPFLKIIRETKWKVNDSDLWLNNQNYFLATDIWEVVKAFVVANKKPVVFDFALTQPFIFSDIKLSWNKLKSFNSMFYEQFSTLPKPDIIIEVTSDSSVIIDRLAKRWKHIDDFIIKMTEKINSYYEWWLLNQFYWDSKVLKFDNNSFESDKEVILDKVLKLLKWLI